MLTEPKITAFLPTTKPRVSKLFYKEVIGLKLVSEDNFAIEFKGKGTSLRITVVDDFEPHPFTVLGFQVMQIDAEVKTLIEKNVTLENYTGLKQDGLGIWTSPSQAKIVWFKDPDGNLISLTQYP